MRAAAPLCSAIAVAACVLAFDAPARAEPRLASVAAGSTPIAPAPREAPLKIAKDERVEGLAPGEGSFSDSSRGCVSTGPRGHAPASGTMAWTSVPTGQGVVSARSERLVVTPQSAYLHVVDAWLDPRTHGMRAAGSHDVELTRIAPGSRPVFAFREGAMLHVIVGASRGAAIVAGPGGPASVSCDHVHAVLDTTARGGQSVTAQVFFDANPENQQYRVNVSTSRISTEPEPVLSVAVARLTR